MAPWTTPWWTNDWTAESLDSVSGVYGIDARAMLSDAILAVHIAA